MENQMTRDVRFSLRALRGRRGMLKQMFAERRIIHMYRKTAIGILGVMVLVSGVWFFSRGDSGADDILKLARNGAGERALIDAVDRHPGRFSLSTDDVVELKKANVPDAVVVRMLKKQVDVRPAAAAPGPSE